MKRTGFCGMCLLGFLFLTRDAQAYLDPGTGSMLLQALLAIFLIVGSSISIFWSKIKKFFSGDSDESVAGSAESSDEQEDSEKGS